jgi:hypothetical protein
MTKDWDFKQRALEADAEEEACVWAEANGWLARKVQYVGRKNCVDRHFYGYGAVVMIEFKRPGEELRIGQAKEHARLIKAGLKPHVCRSKGEAVAILQRYMG